MSSLPIVHVVDDDPGMRKSMRLMLESASMDVRTYDSGEAFLDSIEPQPYGCVVMDLRMPGAGGIEILKRLRAARNEIPAIIISGHVDVPTAIRGMKLGAIDVLQKPFEPRGLLDAIRDAIRKSGETHQRRLEETAAQSGSRR